MEPAPVPPLCYMLNAHLQNLYTFISCRNDFVKIKDEKNNLIKKSCGKKSPFGFSIANRYAIVNMHSDGGIEKIGFHANYFLIREQSKGVYALKYMNIVIKTMFVM
jgi:hypothetical protein